LLAAQCGRSSVGRWQKTLLAACLFDVLAEQRAEMLHRGWSAEMPEWVFCSDAGAPLMSATSQGLGFVFDGALTSLACDR
jgi:hypothetical protein